MNTTTVQHQQDTLVVADAWGEPWTEGEVQLLMECKDDVPLFEIAEALGRTYYAVMAKVQHLLKGGHNGQGARKPGRPVLPYDHGFTIIPDAW